MEKNYNSKPLIFSLLIILFLTIITFVQGNWEIGNFKLKSIDFFADIKKDTTVYYEQRLLTLAKQITETKNLVQQDSFLVYNDNSSFLNLKNFWKALKNRDFEVKQINIAYFGDSEIEGDLITGDLRNYLQAEYGGRGVGFLPFASIDAQFRNSVSFDYDDKLIETFALNKVNKIDDYGISGAYFIPQKDFQITYNCSQQFNKSPFIRVFYKIIDTSKPTYLYCNDDVYNIYAVNNKLSQLLIQNTKEYKYFNFKFPVPNLKLYGVSFEAQNGIYVDNFSLRGYTGTTLNKIPSENLREFKKNKNYKLIIFQYGMNILNDQTKDYTFYKNSMKNVIEYFKSNFPEADILIIGVGDKGKKIGENYLTDENIFNLIKAQKDLAIETKSSFINLFELMGGVNSMTKWVDKGWAAKDYIHISRTGSKHIAKKIYNLIVNYNSVIAQGIQN
jgi:lysophospholipase L1-like esterase